MRALVIACAILPLGCRQLLSSDSYQFTEGNDSGSEDAGATEDSGNQGGAVEAGGDGGPGCKLAGPLERKITMEVGGTTELVFVTRNMDVGETTGDDGIPRYLKLGYDLDNHCGGDRRCKNPLDMNPEARAGINGIDDALGRMIANIKVTFGTEILSSALVNQETADGQLPPVALFRIRNYYGLQDDNHVDVDWYFPVLTGTGTDGGPPADAGSQPKWDGSDVWPIEPKTFVQPASPDGKNPGGATLERTSTEAYVQSYHLVARFPDGIPFRFWLFGAPLYAPLVTADIHPNTATGKFELRNGLITGRSDMRDVLGLIPTMTLALPTMTALCSDSPLYPAISDFICTYPDLSSSNTDGSDCDMMSVALGFDTVPAHVGSVSIVTPPEPLCPPEFDPAKQRCFAPRDGGAD
jgi:hypothetical protein